MTPAQQIERTKLIAFHGQRLQHLLSIRPGPQTERYLLEARRASVRRTLSELANLGVDTPLLMRVWNGEEGAA